MRPCPRPALRRCNDGKPAAAIRHEPDPDRGTTGRAYPHRLSGEGTSPRRPRYGAGTQGRSRAAFGYASQIGTDRAGIAIAFGELPGDAFRNVGVRQYRALRPCPRPAPGPRPSPGRQWKASRQHPLSPTPDRGPTPHPLSPTPIGDLPGGRGHSLPCPITRYVRGYRSLSPPPKSGPGTCGNVPGPYLLWQALTIAGEDANWRVSQSVSSGEVEI